MPKYTVKKSYTDKDTNTLYETGDVVELTKKRADEINTMGKLYFGEEVELVKALKNSE
ncbi:MULTISPECIES: hypothetical protein [unclassified Streptococcus]|uniref:hypothetical protein n=1 Tax=unclassified Streptococcus TaxID=2608887 RepID=UPI00142F8453|nr:MULTISPECIES: hypothetical protein [unclassified Streptococcus]MBF0788168.1 hypothetical protein [Streptococcus sp. 19428wC2_LYSM12]MCQ9212279.1 hypothetical protein [Streptococcus sp. B01]MCQ9213610.1 hypothetical protein [Streptococcus sp. O1]